MLAFWWTLTLLLMLAGFIGTAIPLVPGTAIILAAAVMHRLVRSVARSSSATRIS